MFILFIVAALVLLPYQGFGQQCESTCPKTFTYYKEGKKCYRAFYTRLNWGGALSTCSQWGSHLVSITSDASIYPLNEVIAPIKAACMNKALGSPTFWTSGTRSCPKGPFIWVPNRGIKMDMWYTHWLRGEPNNANGNEDCILFLADDRYLGWNDTACGLANCFVCEVDM